MSTGARELTMAGKVAVFKIATRGLTKHYDLEQGMSDEELENALKDVLGIFGGCGGPARLSVSYQGAGLKIWGGWHIVNHISEKPLFEGRVTVAMAREVWGIADPANPQLVLL